MGNMMLDRNLINELKDKALNGDAESVKKLRKLKVLKNKKAYKASHSQKRMWFLTQLDGSDKSYYIPALLKVTGEPDLNRFEKAINRIIERHQALRTTFKLQNEELIQIVHESYAFKLDYEDLTDKRIQLDTYIRSYLDKNFVLEKLPLFRAEFIKLSDQEFLFIFNMHHIIGDGWSLGIFLDELKKFYKNDTIELDLPKIQYKDFSAWQAKRIIDGDFDQHKSFWIDHLHESKELDLLTNMDRPVKLDYSGNHIWFHLSKELTSSITMLRHELGVTTYGFMTALIKILLWKYTNQTDIVIGSPVTGRNHPDLDNQIGYYINTICLRSKLNPEQSIDNFIREFNSNMAKAFEYDEYPFDLLVEELDVERKFNRNPVFDVMVSWMLQNNMNFNEQVAELHFSKHDLDIQHSQVDLTFNLDEKDEQIFVGIEYSTELFVYARIDEMKNDLLKLTEIFTNNSQLKLRDIKLRDHVRFEATNTDFCLNQKLIEAFKNYSDRVALSFKNTNITYKELEEEVNKYRSAIDFTDKYIVAYSNNPLTIVSAWISALLSGNGFITIDPKSSGNRMDEIVSDLDNISIITDNEHQSTLDNYGKILENSFVETITDPINGELGYCIFTSGSTGKPKGIEVSKSALNTFLASAIREYGYNDISGSELMLVSFSFDVAIKQVFLNIVFGQKVIVLDEFERLDFSTLVDKLNEVNRVDLSPGLFNEFVEHDLLTNPKLSLEQIFIGSEALPKSMIEKFYQKNENPSFELYNCYGPSEATVEVTAFKITKDVLNRSEKYLSIGKPLDNVMVDVWDSFNNPTPLYTLGEIVIKGNQVAGGYINQEELSAKQFRKVDNETVYFTGDLAFFDENMDLHFYGRNDDQIKISGFRIELGEIEAKAISHNEVDVAIADVRQLNNKKNLCLWFTGSIEEGDLKEYLRKKLSSYMIPTYISKLEDIPLKANGKVDKSKLVVCNNTLEEIKQNVTKNEELISAIWKKVLDQEYVTLNANFFEQGGSSLKLIKLQKMLNELSEVDVSIQDLFVMNSVAQQAKLLEGNNCFVVPGIELKVETNNSWGEEIQLEYDFENNIEYNLSVALGLAIHETFDVDEVCWIELHNGYSLNCIDFADIDDLTQISDSIQTEKIDNTVRNSNIHEITFGLNCDEYLCDINVKNDGNVVIVDFSSKLDAEVANGFFSNLIKIIDLLS
jgi:amino acid adenylation domain-containing protein